MSAARIILVRHGRSTHSLPTGLLARDGVEHWFGAYDAAGIQSTDQPPASVARMAADATHVIASDMRRAVDSAARLATDRPIQIDALFREAPLGIPRWPTRLPMTAWATLMHLGWTYRLGRSYQHREPAEARATTAAVLLSELVADGSTALVVTHAVFRRLLADELFRLEWRRGSRAGGYRHWSAWTFDRS